MAPAAPVVEHIDPRSVVLGWTAPGDHQRATLEMEEQAADGSCDWVRLYTGSENNFKVGPMLDLGKEHNQCAPAISSSLHLRYHSFSSDFQVDDIDPGSHKSFRVRYVDADGSLDVSAPLCLEFSHSNGPSTPVNAKTASAGKIGKSEMRKPRNGFHPEVMENGHGPRENGFVHTVAKNVSRAEQSPAHPAHGANGDSARRGEERSGAAGTQGIAADSAAHDPSNGSAQGHRDASVAVSRARGCVPLLVSDRPEIAAIVESTSAPCQNF